MKKHLIFYLEIFYENSEREHYLKCCCTEPLSHYDSRIIVVLCCTMNSL